MCSASATKHVKEVELGPAMGAVLLPCTVLPEGEKKLLRRAYATCVGTKLL